MSDMRWDEMTNVKWELTLILFAQNAFMYKENSLIKSWWRAVTWFKTEYLILSQIISSTSDSDLAQISLRSCSDLILS